MATRTSQPDRLALIVQSLSAHRDFQSSLEKLLDPLGPANSHRGVIDREINRLDRIVKDFLQFTRPSAHPIPN